MSLLKKILPTSSSIQKEYVEKRKRELFANDPAKTDRVKAKILALHGLKEDEVDWHDTYLKIHRSLRSASLTINIEAGNWFSKENRYTTYAQMYQRSVGKDGKMVLTNSDSKNPAAARAIVDDLVTIPDAWAHAHPFSQRKRLYNALHATGATQKSTVSLMNPSQDLRPTLKGDAKSGYTTSNKSFKANAKQVFAALNYGRRAHGSCTYYGYSYLVLNPSLRNDAIYFPGDTFYTSTKGTSHQAAYNTIGALLDGATPSLQREIWASCFLNRTLADTPDGDYLIEAHIFKQIKVAEDVQDLVLSRKRSDKLPPWSENEWRDIIANATAWCQLNGVRLNFASP